MNITLLGSSPHLHWFAKRLTDSGLVVDTVQSPSREAIGHDWHSGLMTGNLLVDTGPTPLTARVERALACGQAGYEYAELAGHWLAPGVTYGFPLFVGASPTARDGLRPIFDALAPQAGAWLFCGPAGGGCYAASTFDALTSAMALAMQAGWTVPGETPRPPDWTEFFQQQTELATRLLDWARLYLSLHPAEPEQELRLQLTRFSTPPALQAHFAANLARLIVLALGQGLAVQEILQTLLPIRT